MDFISIAEYQNYTNNDGSPKGHGSKSLQEAFELIYPFYPNVRIISSTEYFGMKYDNRLNLSSIVREKNHKIIRFYKLIRNLRRVFGNVRNNEIIWFTNVDWFFFFYIGVFHNKGKIMATMYNDAHEMFIKNRPAIIQKVVGGVIKKGLAKIDLALVTPPKLVLSDIKKQINIPDFFYSSKYDKYREMDKDNSILCIGLMHENKDIMGVVSHFRNSEIKVRIIGDFYDVKLYQKVKAIATSNIIVENRRIPEDEYYDLMGKTKYIILPYIMEQYHGATSGILLETVFVNSIPIAPSFLLEENNLKGIGYQSIDKLPLTIEELCEASSAISNSIEYYVSEQIINEIKKL